MNRLSLPPSEMRAFRKWTEQISKEEKAKFKNLVARSTELFVKEAKRAAPVNKQAGAGGRLRSSINSSYSNDGLGSETEVGVNYAECVEMGTKPHIIRAKNAPFLHFKTKMGWVRKKEVKHPGTKAQPFFFNTFDRVNKAFLKELNKMGFYERPV